MERVSKNELPSWLPPSFVKMPNLWWGGLSFVVWAGISSWRSHGELGLFASSFLKGSILLAEACAVYHFSPKKGLSFLGLFPLLWLAVSRFQWNIVTGGEKQWLWAVLWLASYILLLKLPDGKRLLVVYCPVWVVLTLLFPFSMLLPLAFLTAFKGRFKRSFWLQWGGLAMTLVFCIYFKAWQDLSWDWWDFWDVFMTQRFISFILFAWLGLAAFPKKGTSRFVVAPFLLLVLGFFWGMPVYSLQLPLGLLIWALIFLSGFGFESFRRDLMDPSWSARLLWAAIGIGLATGIW